MVKESSEAAVCFGANDASTIDFGILGKILEDRISPKRFKYGFAVPNSSALKIHEHKYFLVKCTHEHSVGNTEIKEIIRTIFRKTNCKNGGKKLTIQ